MPVNKNEPTIAAPNIFFNICDLPLFVIDADSYRVISVIFYVQSRNCKRGATANFGRSTSKSASNRFKAVQMLYQFATTCAETGRNGHHLQVDGLYLALIFG